MINRFHPSYHAYAYLSGSRIDIERTLDFEPGEEDFEELVDVLSEPPHFFERLSPITAKVGERELQGRNWTDLSIKCYREFGKIFARTMVFLEQSLREMDPGARPSAFLSLAVDPCTLSRLIEYDFEAGENSYIKLIELFESGAVSPVVTPPFQSLLPLMPSAFDRRLCIRMAFRFAEPLLRAYERHLKDIGENRMVIAFWPPQCAANHETLALIRQEYERFVAHNKFHKPRLLVYLDAELAEGLPLDSLMKNHCRVCLNGDRGQDFDVVFRDGGFSDWMVHSHPSIKKMIDRTIAKVSGALNEQGIDYAWAHFENIDALTWSPRDAVHFEQRNLKLCELGYLPVSPDTFVRRKLLGLYGSSPEEPMPVRLRDPLDDAGDFAPWLGWERDEQGRRRVAPARPFERRLPRGTEKRQGSPCWKIAWSETRKECFGAIWGDPENAPESGLAVVLAGLSGADEPDEARRRIEAFLEEYALIHWREHFTQHELTEADIRLDEIVARTLLGGQGELDANRLAAVGLAARAYFFLLDSGHSFALEASNLDQRGMFQNAMMLTLAFADAVAALGFLGREDEIAALLDLLESRLFRFEEAWQRLGLEDYGVSEEQWCEALEPLAEDARLNVVARAARRTAARHLAPLGYEDRFPVDDEELSANVGHFHNGQPQSPNHRWANPYFCGVKEA